MDFSNLPDDVFIKIVEYLPLGESIRAGRVDRSFRRIAQFVTSRTKSISFRQLLRVGGRFRNITPDQLGVILDLCWPNLELADLDFSFGFNNYVMEVQLQVQLATKFASYHYPRLTDIDIGHAPIGNSVFEQFIRNAPNVERLVCGMNSDFVFPDITMNSLKKLKMSHGYVDDTTLQSLIDRCPNLTELKMGLGTVTADLLDEFLASVPQVNRMSIMQSSVPDIDLEDLENLWQLPLTCLTIPFQPSPTGDHFMHMVSTSFPHLQHLSVDPCNVTNVGVAALSDLQELETLFLNQIILFDDEGIRQLANCKKLRRLDIHDTRITGVTLIALLRGCPQLEHIDVFEIYQVDTAKEAAVVLESLCGIVKREITIKIDHEYDNAAGFSPRHKRIWNSKAVKLAIEKLEEGLKINIILEDENTDIEDEEDSEDYMDFE